MSRTTKLLIAVVTAFAMSVAAYADDQLPEVPGIIGLTPVEEGACIAVFVPMSPGDALEGISWYNNDGSVVFPAILIASGVAGSPEPVAEAFTVAENASGGSSAWSTLEFSEPIAAANEGFYVVFQVPEGSEHTAYGFGGGAGIGYTAGANGFTGWISQEGEDWMMLDEEFGIALVPMIIPATEGMIEKSLENPAEVPVAHTALLLPTPNPFNPSTVLHYQLKSDSNVDLSIYNIRGVRIAQLVSGSHSSGRYDVTWRGCDTAGRRVASGTYFARFQADGVVQTQRLMLVK